MTVDYIPALRVTDVNCVDLFNGNEHEIRRASLSKRNDSQNISFGVHLNAECDTFIATRGYMINPVCQEEADFPLAYAILVYKDVQQMEYLLRAIYRPQNRYCIHVDKKATDDVFQAVATIAKCFHNVFLTSKSVEVTWGSFSVIEGEIICMEELVKYQNWKYFINLTGQEYPLKTNLDLVRILTILNGTSDVEGQLFSRYLHRSNVRLKDGVNNESTSYYY